MPHSTARTTRIVLAVLLLAIGTTTWAQPSPETFAPAPLVLRLDVEGAIGPATSEYITNGLNAARERNAAMVILYLDTPGGLDTAMRDIIRGILTSPVPIATYVAPSGARAASAGTYILYASHIAAMSPGTNLGAATPVQIGGGLPLPGSPEPRPSPTDAVEPAGPEPDTEEAKADESATASEKETDEPEDNDTTAKPPLPTDAMGAKVVNDAAAYIRSLADMRGRNADWAEKAVRQAASLSSREALAEEVIDVVADTIPDLLDQINGRTVKMVDEEITLDVANAVIQAIEPDWRIRLLSIITSPNIAFILMLVGTYGLIFELANPGAIIPGTLGAISLLLALYALNVLPVNYAGLGLILLGIALITAEAFAPSFGVLGLGGIAAFIIGATFLFDTDVPGLALSWPVIVGTTVFTAGFILLVMYMAIGAHRRKVVSGREEIVGATANVSEWAGTSGWVEFHGETWRAEGPDGLTPGIAVEIKDRHGLTVVVVPPTSDAGSGS